MKTFLVSVCAAVGAHAFSVSDSTAAFEQWKVDFAKKYANAAEEKRAFITFMANDRIISETNARDLPYKLGHNEFSDITSEEFFNRYTMKLNDADEPPRREKSLLGHGAAPAADEIDWTMACG